MIPIPLEEPTRKELEDKFVEMPELEQEQELIVKAMKKLIHSKYIKMKFI